MPKSLNDISRQCREDSRRWFPETANSLTFLGLALCGEAGELANVIKKIARGSLNMKDASTKNALVGEMADVLTYLCDMAGELGIDLEKAYDMKRIENERRFGKKAS